MPPVRLIPRHVDEDRNAERRRLRARQRPAAADDGELAVGDLREVREEHRHFHGVHSRTRDTRVGAPCSVRAAARPGGRQIEPAVVRSPARAGRANGRPYGCSRSVTSSGSCATQVPPSVIVLAAGLLADAKHPAGRFHLPAHGVASHDKLLPSPTVSEQGLSI